MSFLQRRRMARAGRHHRRGRTIPARRSQQGISLTELLIGIALSLLVLGAVIQAALSLIRVDTVQQQELNRKDAVDRVLSLIQEEIRGSRRIETTGLTSGSAPNCSTGLTPSLILRGSSAATDVAYLVGQVTAAGTYTSTGWIGPRVLVRCGPPYTATGALDGSQPAAAQVILDSLADTNALVITPPTTTAGNLSRTLGLTLNSSARGFNNSTTTIANTVQVAIGSNQAYGLLAAGGPDPGCTTAATSGCNDPSDSTGNTRYFTATGTSAVTLSGTVSAENTVYFDRPRSDFSISGPTNSRCTAVECWVTFTGTGGARTTILNGSVLIFRDEHIRIPPQ